MEDIKAKVLNEISNINPNWLNYFNNLKHFEYYHQFINYITTVYFNNPNISPKLEDLFNPFKYTDPYEVLAVIISNTCDITSQGLAYSSRNLTKVHEVISRELTDEYKLFTGYDIIIKDPSFKSLAVQGVFMPNINLFYKVQFSKSPDCVKMFWEYIFKSLADLGCIVWFAWGSEDIEPYVNKILNISEESLDKKKPDEKAKVSTNPKLRDNKLTSDKFKGLGCFNICNKYLAQYHRKQIDWINI